MKKLIKITGISSTEKKITILDDKLKYNFWIKKKSGEPTKANIQFSSLELGIGKSIEAEVDEVPTSFVNDKGQTVNFTDRKILYFYEERKGFLPTQNKPQIIPQTTIEKQLNQLASRVSELEKAVKNLITPDKYQFNIHKDKQEETNEDVEPISLEDIPF